GRLVRKIELSVTFCLLGKAQKGGGKIFQLGAHLWIVFDFGAGQELKSLRAIFIPRDHSEDPMSFYTALPRVMQHF
ncbi:MAG: hypothetical protein WCA54_15045, partial [Pseudolabrys sp.]